MVRARYHLQPRRNWMNDPNGPAMIGGQLHMFYQHNPQGSVWGNMTWGHAVSEDLVHWRHCPHALSPDMPYDGDGVYSGCCVVHEGLPHILYTGVQPETLCLAIGDAAGETFTKYEGNPILTPPQGKLSGWRDPFVWKQDGQYRMVIGSGTPGEGGWLDQYRSADLIHWERMEPLARGVLADGDMWECPNVIPDGKGNMLLVVSALPGANVRYAQGALTGDRVQIRRLRNFDLGDSFYAPNTLIHPDGRAIQWGWMRECGDEGERVAQGWQGMLTIPREILPDRDAPRVRPVREMNALRGELLLERRDFSLHSGENACKGISGQHLEILLRFEPGSASLVLEMLRAGAKACARLCYDGSTESVEVDLTSLSGGAPRVVGGAVEHRGEVELRIFIDGTALEAFINARETLTTRVYPTDGCDGLRLYAEGTVRVRSLKIYAMKSAYADDNT